MFKIMHTQIRILVLVDLFYAVCHLMGADLARSHDQPDTTSLSQSINSPNRLSFVGSRGATGFSDTLININSY